MRSQGHFCSFGNVLIAVAATQDLVQDANEKVEQDMHTQTWSDYEKMMLNDL